MVRAQPQSVQGVRALQYSRMRLSGVRQMTLMRLRVLSNSRMFRISYSSSVVTAPTCKTKTGCRVQGVACRQKSASHAAGGASSPCTACAWCAAKSLRAACWCPGTAALWPVPAPLQGVQVAQAARCCICSHSQHVYWRGLSEGSTTSVAPLRLLLPNAQARGRACSWTKMVVLVRLWKKKPNACAQSGWSSVARLEVQQHAHHVPTVLRGRPCPSSQRL